jgi:hypothetical protein
MAKCGFVVFWLLDTGSKIQKWDDQETDGEF